MDLLGSRRVEGPGDRIVVAQEAQLQLARHTGLALSHQEIRQLLYIFRIGQVLPAQIVDAAVEGHIIENVRVLGVAGDRVEILRKQQHLRAALQEALAQILHHVPSGAEARGTGPKARGGAPVGQTTHGTVDPAAVQADGLGIVFRQLHIVPGVAGVIIVHADAFPLDLVLAVFILAAPVIMLLGKGIDGSGTVWHEVEEDLDALLMGLLHIDGRFLQAAVAQVHRHGVHGLIDIVTAVVEHRQEPDGIEAHGGDVGDLLRVLLQGPLVEIIGIHGAVGMAGIDRLEICGGSGILGGMVAQLGPEFADRSIGILLRLQQRQVQSAHFHGGVGSQDALGGRQERDTGLILVVIVAGGGPFLHLVHIEDVAGFGAVGDVDHRGGIVRHGGPELGAGQHGDLARGGGAGVLIGAALQVEPLQALDDEANAIHIHALLRDR